MGSGYVWSGYTWTGSTSTSSFTCSGLVDYALGYSPQSHWPESFMAITGNSKSASQLAYGDLVYYSYAGRYPGHVAIYVGGGQVVDALPGLGVTVHDMYYCSGFMGGGTFY